jgi:prepilin-type N-terminal cleavage/methylation domain-containing protein
MALTASLAEMELMPTFSVGRTRTTFFVSRFSFLVGRALVPWRETGNAKRKTQNEKRRGITLIEMVVVVAIISLMVGISFPALSSGIDSLRLNAATNGVVSFFNSGLNRAERRQQVVEITISKTENALSMRSTEQGFYRKLDMPEGIAITRILPESPADPNAPRIFLLYPGGTVPRFGLQLMNRRNVERIVRVDPITGVPQVERMQQ